jgi:hypothetical protein
MSGNFPQISGALEVLFMAQIVILNFLGLFLAVKLNIPKYVILIHLDQKQRRIVSYLPYTAAPKVDGSNSASEYSKPAVL